MKFFYLGITKNPLEISEVHLKDCPHLPPMLHRTYLGPFNNAKEALRSARERKKNVTTCVKCCGNKMHSVAVFTPKEYVEQ